MPPATLSNSLSIHFFLDWWLVEMKNIENLLRNKVSMILFQMWMAFIFCCRYSYWDIVKNFILKPSEKPNQVNYNRRNQQMTCEERNKIHKGEDLR